MLKCDFGNLHREFERLGAAGTEVVHLDVMDGHFVDNISFGPAFVSAAAAEAAAQAAQAGVQWGLYQALNVVGTWKASCGAAQTLDLRSDTGFRVTVSCASTDYFEGESIAGTPQLIRLYTLTAVACNGSASSCPDGASIAGPAYVERRQEVQAVDPR